MFKKEKTNFKKGVDAERLAADYLQVQGYSILKNRYKTKFGEIDLIVQHKNLIAFVEVKRRASIEDALYAVQPRAKIRIQNAALHFISAYPQFQECDMRFDVVAVSADGGISHLDNAWEARS